MEVLLGLELGNLGSPTKKADPFSSFIIGFRIMEISRSSRSGKQQRQEVKGGYLKLSWTSKDADPVAMLGCVSSLG